MYMVSADNSGSTKLSSLTIAQENLINLLEKKEMRTELTHSEGNSYIVD